MPSSSSSDSGQTPAWKQFEQHAATFLENQGFEILERNYRAGRREIDIIARDKRTLVFVEVKSSGSKQFGHPAERVDNRKIGFLTQAAQQYLEKHDIGDLDLRFDVITFSDGRLEHFPNAFEAAE